MFILVNLAAGCGNDTIGFFYLVMAVNLCGFGYG
jgi:hypothetical protein